MRYWTREIAGWLLIAAGLFLIWLAYDFCDRTRPLILAAWPTALSGIFVFRGGIHLVKVAVAARICLQAQERLYPPPETGLRTEARPTRLPRREEIRR